jgi:hypothetical protein
MEAINCPLNKAALEKINVSDEDCAKDKCPWWVDHLKIEYAEKYKDCAIRSLLDARNKKESVEITLPCEILLSGKGTCDKNKSCERECALRERKESNYEEENVDKLVGVASCILHRFEGNEGLWTTFREVLKPFKQREGK